MNSTHRMNRLNRFKKANRGFTLIELMIVIAIIGVLAAIAVPNFKAAREKANTKACWANQKTIAGALEMYNLDNNAQLAQVDQASLDQLKTQGYIQSVPKDPGGGDQINLEIDAQGNIKCKTHGAIGTRPGAAGSTTTPPPTGRS